MSTPFMVFGCNLQLQDLETLARSDASVLQTPPCKVGTANNGAFIMSPVETTWNW